MNNFNAYEATEYIRDNLVNYLLDRLYTDKQNIRSQLEQKWSDPDPVNGGVLSKPLFESNFSFQMSDLSFEQFAKQFPGFLNHYQYLCKVQKNHQKINDDLKKQGKTFLHNGVSNQKRFFKIFDDNFFPSDRKLYLHQQVSMEKSINEEKDLVVTAGTGSGKSECFLIPSLIRLFGESDEELSTPGIRVLIIYPMNALINSQMKRLQAWLGIQDPSRPQVKFGFYNSKLKETLKRRKCYQEKTEPYCYWSESQIIDREELRESPPHILVTNYSMLEYSLIRPADNSLYSSKNNKLHTIILDEAHSYTGSLAADITMLIRRILARLDKKAEQVRFFATSATIGDPDSDQGKKLGEFASGLFSKSPENIEIIAGRKYQQELKPDDNSPIISIKDKLNYLSGVLQEIQFTETDPSQEIFNQLRESREDAEKIRTIFKDLKLQSDKENYFNSDYPSEVLWSVLSRIPEILEIRKEIMNKPLYLEEIKEKLDLDIEAAGIIMLALSLSRRREDILPLIPVKLHLTVSGPDGVFVCRNPGCPDKSNGNPLGKLHFTQMSACPSCGKPKMAELVTCKYCGQVYAACISKSKDGEISIPQWDKPVTDLNLVKFDENGFSHKDLDKVSKCRRCGKNQNGNITSEDNTDSQNQEISESPYFDNYFFRNFSAGNYLIQPALIDYLYECLDPLPVKDNDLLPGKGRRLLSFTDNRHKAARLASRMEWTHENFLIRKILYDSIKNIINNKDVSEIGTSIINNDLLQSIFDLPKNRDHPTVTKLVNLINVISNSDPGDDVLVKQLVEIADQSGCKKDKILILKNEIIEKLLRIAEKNRKKELQFNDFKEYLSKHPYRKELIQLKGIFEKLPGNFSYWEEISKDFNNQDYNEEFEKISEYLIFKEFARPPSYLYPTLETLGLIEVNYEGLSEITASGLEDILNSQELHILISLYFDFFRRGGLVNISDFTNTDDKLFDYCLGERIYFRYKGISLQPDNNKIASFLPRRGENNYSNFLNKIMEKKGIQEDKFKILTEIWNLLIDNKDYYFQKVAPYRDQNGDSFLLKLDSLKFKVPDKIFKCNKCSQVTLRNILSLCSNPGCDGKLEEIDIEYLQKSKNPVFRIFSMKTLGLSSTEHTAQIDTGKLEKNENAFMEGNINLLSSSTTMELGIDIGGLTSVYLSNTPPNSSNYLQRAGRAGRRMDGTSIVLTNTRKTPHDQQLFKHPKHFFENPPRPPYITLNSEKIILRHLNSFLLSSFYSKQPSDRTSRDTLLSYGNIDYFFDGDTEQGKSPADQFTCWLNYGCDSKTIDLLEDLKRSTAVENMENEIIFGNLSEKIKELRNKFIDAKNDLQDSMNETDDEDYCKRIEYQTERLKKTSTVEFLIRKQILPHYGFPIDLLKLNAFNIEKWKMKKKNKNQQKSYAGEKDLRLERTISLALQQYAPGSTIIANKQKIKSEGITFNNLGIDGLREEDRIKYYYICNKCGNLSIIEEEEKDDHKECPVCGTKLDLPGEKTTADACFEDESKTTKPNTLQNLMIPRGFACDFYEKQPPAKGVEKFIYNTIVKAQIKEQGKPFISHYRQKCVKTRHHENGTIVTLLKGLGNDKCGFAICRNCGRVMAEKNYKNTPGYTLKKFIPHNPLRYKKKNSKEKNCEANKIYRNYSFGAEYTTDTLEIKLTGLFQPNFNPTETDIFYETFGKSLLLAASELLEIDPRELNYLISSYQMDDDRNLGKKVILYDQVEGGAGYCEQLSDMVPQLIKLAVERLDCLNPECEEACPECLYTYEGERHQKYNRNLVYKFFMNNPERKAVLLNQLEDIKKQYSEYIEIDSFKILTDVKSLFVDLTHNDYRSITWMFRNIKDKDGLGPEMKKIFNTALENKTDINFIFQHNPSMFTTRYLSLTLGYLKETYRDQIKFFRNENLPEDIQAVLVDRSGKNSLIGRIRDKDPDLIDDADFLESSFVYIKGKIKTDQDIYDSSQNHPLEQEYYDFSSANFVQTPSNKDENFADLFFRKTGISRDTSFSEMWYSDRYIKSKRHLHTLFKIISEFNKTGDFKVKMLTRRINPNMNKPIYAGELTDERKRKEELKKIEQQAAKQQISNVKFSLFCTNYGSSKTIPGNQHQREMLLKDRDGNSYSLILDPGLDIYRSELNDVEDYMNFDNFKFRKGWIFYIGESDYLTLEKRYQKNKDLYSENILKDN